MKSIGYPQSSAFVIPWRPISRNIRPQVWGRIHFFRVGRCKMPCACAWACPSLMEAVVRYMLKHAEIIDPFF